MAYHIYKLQFKSAVHFGAASARGHLENAQYTMDSDSLYSAICNAFVQIFGTAALAALIDQSQQDFFKVSDLLPYKGNTLYLPRPFAQFSRPNNSADIDAIDRKRLKATAFIPAEYVNTYFSQLQSGATIPAIDNDFGKFSLQTKNAVAKRAGEDTQLYAIETFSFHPNSGLYFIAKATDDGHLKLRTVLEHLGDTGIGGKRSSGLGKFCISDDLRPVVSASDAAINQMVHQAVASHYLLLSSYLPTADEIKMLGQAGAFYQLKKCSGFVNRSAYAKVPQKHKQVHMLKSGSLLNYQPVGRLIDLNQHGNHSIYRMGKPIALGVTL